MTLAAEARTTRLGESCRRTARDRDLIHDLSRRLEVLWLYDQYITCERREGLKQFWIELKTQELANIRTLQDLIAEEFRNGCL